MKSIVYTGDLIAVYEFLQRAGFRIVPQRNGIDGSIYFRYHNRSFEVFYGQTVAIDQRNNLVVFGAPSSANQG